MTDILIVRPGAVSRTDKGKLSRIGVVVIESDDPAGVKLIAADRGEVSASGMMLAAMRAITGSSSLATCQIFARELCAVMQAEAKGRGATATGGEHD